LFVSPSPTNSIQFKPPVFDSSTALLASFLDNITTTTTTTSIKEKKKKKKKDSMPNPIQPTPTQKPARVLISRLDWIGLDWIGYL